MYQIFVPRDFLFFHGERVWFAKPMRQCDVQILQRLSLLCVALMYVCSIGACVSGVVRIDAVSVVGIPVFYLSNSIQQLLRSVGRRSIYVNPHKRHAVVFAFRLCVLHIYATCIKLKYIAFMCSAIPFVHELEITQLCVLH